MINGKKDFHMRLLIAKFKASLDTDMSDSCQAEKTSPFPPVLSGLYFISKIISSGEIL